MRDATDKAAEGAEAAGRARWFARTLHQAQAVELPDQVNALLSELETVFTAGADVATVILAAAIVEAQLRHESGAGPMLPAGVIHDEAGLAEDFDWLRHRRNRLVHLSDPPALTPDMFWFEADALAEDARRAVTLVAEILGRNAGP
ncbi:MAG: hypothetical protein RLN64_04970 [Roseitalea porphyridii]